MGRKIFFWIHKWLGLMTGLVVLIISLTGCINVFSDELKAYFYHDRYFVKPQPKGTFLSFSTLRHNAQEALKPGVKISRSEIYPQQNRSWVFRASLTDKKAIGHWNYYKYYYRVYINPYSGKVVYVEDTKNEFFQLVLDLHMNLLLGEHIGTAITGISASCFLILLITGFLIWSPRRWTIKAFKRSMLFRKGVGIKRLTYDLHNILGFYMLIPAMVICLTGLVFAYPWADSSTQYIANGGRALAKRKIPLSTPNEDYPKKTIDNIVSGLLNKHANADVLAIRFRERDTDPLDIQVRLAKNRTHLFQWYYFDRNSGKMLLNYNDNNISGGEKLRSMNYDLHTGAFAGFPTKILAFVISLLCALMPVTGFLMWYNKSWAKGKTKKKAV